VQIPQPATIDLATEERHPTSTRQACQYVVILEGKVIRQGGELIVCPSSHDCVGHLPTVGPQFGTMGFQANRQASEGSFVAGKEDARGSNCFEARHSICQPKSLGGLGFHNLRWMNVAMCARWTWF
jgi:hypothetical protein